MALRNNLSVMKKDASDYAIPSVGANNIGNASSVLRGDGSNISGIAGSGNTISPETNTDNNIPQWDGTDSKTLKNGLGVQTTLTDSDSNLPTSGSVVDYVSANSINEVVDDTTPQLGGNLDLNGKSFVITGQTVGGSDGDLVYLSSANTWSQTDADAEATTKGMLGIRVNATTVLVKNIFTTTGLTAGAIYYVSTTAGGITATAPSATGDFVRIIGYALSTTQLFFDPDKTYIEVA